MTEYTAGEIANILAVAKSTIIRRAAKEAWPYIEQAVRGGRQRLYPYETLPESVRAALGQGKTVQAVPTAQTVPIVQAVSAVQIVKTVGTPLKTAPPAWAVTKALARADLVRGFTAEKEAAKARKQSLVEAGEHFVSAYKSGLLYNGIKESLGETSLGCLYAWEKTFRDADYDYQALLPGWGNGRRGACSATEEEKNYILTLVLHQNKVKIGTAINIMKHLMARRGVESPSHPSTLRRFVETFKKTQYDKWILAREGEKALIDKVLPYLERDDSLLNVGDVLVADGHRCNFKVINPFTGKPCRPTLIGFYDWASRVMVGWSIMVTENVQAIAAALRMAVLNLGKMPKYVLLDNGKAFKSRIFTSDINLEEAGVYGMFARLGIHTCFAWPYNARSKPIERFFGTLSDTFERMLPSFSGASIEDKPARLLRNEKFMQVLAPERIPTSDEVYRYLTAWQDYYCNMEHPTRKGQTRREVFFSGRGSGVDADELIYMMMSMEIRTVGRNGVTFLGNRYWSDDLYGLKDRVIIRYDLGDLSHLYIFQADGTYMGRADAVEKVHPMYHLSDNPDMSYTAIQHGIKQQRSLLRDTKRVVKKALTMGRPGAIDALPWNNLIEISPNLPETIERMEAEMRTDEAPAAMMTEIKRVQPVETVQDVQAGQDTRIVRDVEPNYEYPYERYNWLLKQPVLTADQKGWIEEYTSGRIFPGEWQMIYGKKKAEVG